MHNGVDEVMKFKILILVLSQIIFTPQAHSQSLGQYQWNNRLLILSAPDVENDSFQKQLEILNSDLHGLSERKLVVFERTPYTLSMSGDESEETGSLKKWYERLDIDKSEFSVVLIGLDGGEKHKQSVPMELNRLYGIIDKMPMRRAEVRRVK